jgi:hypothetical protein
MTWLNADDVTFGQEQEEDVLSLEVEPPLPGFAAAHPILVSTGKALGHAAQAAVAHEIVADVLMVLI